MYLAGPPELTRMLSPDFEQAGFHCRGAAPPQTWLIAAIDGSRTARRPCPLSVRPEMTNMTNRDYLDGG